MIAALLPAVCAQGEIPAFREQFVDDQPGDLRACAIADLHGDRRPDLVIAWGRRLKIYFNEGK